MHVNLIDTPGYPDFRGPALSALAAVETVAIVVDAATGVDYGARRMMEHAKARGLCRVIVVNKIDQDGAAPAQELESIRRSFGTACLPLTLPADGGNAVIDCLGNTKGESDTRAVAEQHQQQLEHTTPINDYIN